MAAPSSYQGPRAEQKGKRVSASQDAHIAFEKAYSNTTVGDILEEAHGVLYSVTVNASLASVIAELNVRKIGNMPVVDPNAGLVGVVSERDVIRATGDLGEEALSRPVKDFMTANPKTCSKGDKVGDVMKRMTDGRFRHMPVVDGDVLEGVISIRDIVMHRVKEVEFEALRLKQLLVG
ncbi:CBS domain-containing protein [uncultured Cohaesibacter sp.]|uniref:CBS domain-containing protein n=1 Tax=uncultured Cohaesibacter sp. TaxID=1002546 RepID=UPI0029C8A976|nr:CBS domain-containing protein [uncultured Cohaesibacter sp.]